MKRVLVMLAIVWSSAHIFASELVVKGNIDVPFSVFINGEKYYSYNNKVNVGYLPSGRYGMEIYTEGNSYELLYDYSIDIPRHATVYATFTGDNRMYISTRKDGPATVVVDLTPYPRHVYVPSPKPVVHHHVHHASPSPKPVVHHHVHHASPTPKHVHHSSPAPRKNSGSIHKTTPAPKSSCRSNPKGEGGHSKTKSVQSARSTVHTR